VLHTFVGSTLDDLMHEAVHSLLQLGELIEPTRGSALELTGVALELSNPRARLSRTETRGKVFSALGELCWYLSGSNELTPITYYIPKYSDEAEDGKVHGGYGPRLFAFDGFDQVQYVIAALSKNKSSRRAVIQIFDHRDVAEKHREVPCTCTLQFLVRGGALQMITYMRSNDAYLGLPHDIFAFTMLQELVAKSVGLPLGRYLHMVGSFHLYTRDQPAAENFLQEGWQTSILPMPTLPDGDPWPGVQQLLVAERHLREGGDISQVPMPTQEYWKDLALLLCSYAANRRRDWSLLADLRGHVVSNVYDIFIPEHRPN
jgi:thymidylate synthase